MKLCVITPTSHLNLASYGNGIHMALTHLALENDDYVRSYRRYKNKGEYLILDNSAFELEQQGKGLDPLPVLEASRLLGADEVIATDVLCEGTQTVQSTRDFIKEFYAFYGEEIRLEKPRPKIMAVPQGRTLEEWIDCYLCLINTEGVDAVGFSKISATVVFGGPTGRQIHGGVTQARLKLYRYLTENMLWPTDLNRSTEVHLLGGDSWSGHELHEISKHYSKHIRSNDTSAPIWYGANGISFDPFTGKASKFISEKPDLENNRQETKELIDKNMSLVLQNICTLLKFANHR